eukprot:TRINITY_DN470_c0_g1_i3.p1 TRINITY_DN470_c0_g1~~TRINITY_DN470_c0_g1_i3.p1  ORF type:complete len:516 (+),score=61.33 TRINITY_DN470_c0_g1_i3:36-1550(+)
MAAILRIRRIALRLRPPLYARGVAQVQLTADRYPVRRGPYAQVSHEDVARFQSIVGPQNVLLNEDMESLNTDWLRTVRGQATVALRPGSTQEVSEVMRHCNERKLAVCPQGGNTGLCAGSVPVFDEVILLLNRMSTIEHVDPVSGVMVCGAGAVLEHLDSSLRERGLIMPLDLGAKGSCQIGGNVSTNAGGLRLLRYGSLHGSVLGVEAVLADGTVLDCLSTLRKDNTGYDMKQLFIGSEGTLGIVTRVSILCPPKPNSVKIAFLGVSDWQGVMTVFQRAKRDMGEILSAFEFLDNQCLAVHERNPHMKVTSPISSCPFYVVIESHGSNDEHDEDKLQAFLGSILEDGLAVDGAVGATETQSADLWSLRERISEGLTLDGYTYKYDISVPIDVMYDVVEACRARMGNLATCVVGFGHIGDSNLHLNITSPEYNKEIVDLLEPWVQEQTAQRGGSISAEHGLGFKKRDQIFYSKSKDVVRQMQLIKSAFDPHGILNPYKTIPDPE